MSFYIHIPQHYGFQTRYGYYFRYWQQHATVLVSLEDHGVWYPDDSLIERLGEQNKLVSWYKTKCRLTMDNFDNEVEREHLSGGIKYKNGDFEVIVMWEEYELYKDRQAFISWLLPLLNRPLNSKLKKVVVRDIRQISKKA